VRGIQFVKLVGAGNDFVLVDRTDTSDLVPIQDLARAMCAFHLGVGADGLIVVDDLAPGRIAITVVNPDGSVATMCGNAARSAAYYALSTLGCRSVDVHIGNYCLAAEWDGDDVSTSFDEPEVSTTRKLAGYTWYGVHSGTEHVVAIVPDLRECDIATIGAQVRHHEFYRPVGTNVNVVQIVDRETIRIRTFERGAERETLSCASGAVAATTLAAHLGLIQRGRVSVWNLNNTPLRITLPAQAGPGNHLRVAGPSAISFTGMWPLADGGFGRDVAHERYDHAGDVHTASRTQRGNSSIDALAADGE
jgi:diaminopimelate epimerase